MIFFLLFACRSATAPVSPPPVPDATVWQGAETLTLGTGEACTIVAIHGYGADPQGMRRLYEGMQLDAIVVLPRAPHPKGRGWAWFMSSWGTPPDVYAEAIHAAADRLAQGLQAGVPGSRTEAKPIITGFSQGGMLSWTLSAQHPELVKAAFPIGGLLPTSLMPTSVGQVPIESFHGDADKVVPHAEDLRSVEAMKALGWPVIFHSYEGVPHTISPQMHRDYEAALRRGCEAG